MSQGLLAQKLSQSGVARSPLPDTDLIGETYARMVEDVLRPLVKTTVSALLLESRVLKLGSALEDISVPAMLGLIEVEDSDSSGLISIDTSLAYHLIDLMLGGDPTQAPLPISRTLSGIDMALGRLHQEALLEALAKAVTTVTNRPLAKMIRVGSQHQNISQIRFAPNYIDILLFTLALDIGDAARTGSCAILLPLATLDVIRAAVKGAGSERTRPDDLWRVAMRGAAASAPVTIRAVLSRRLLTLGEVQDLRLGDVVPLPSQAIAHVELEIDQPGSKRATIARGRVGGYKNRKVVRLAEDIDPRLRQHVRHSL